MNFDFTGSFLPFPHANSSAGSCSAEEQPEHWDAVPGSQAEPFPLGAHTQGYLGMQPGAAVGSQWCAQELSRVRKAVMGSVALQQILVPELSI